MKVVYKKSIIDKLIDVIEDARSSGKEIEKIIVTRAEAYVLKEIYHLGDYYLGGTFNGVPIEVEGK